MGSLVLPVKAASSLPVPAHSFPRACKAWMLSPWFTAEWEAIYTGCNPRGGPQAPVTENPSHENPKYLRYEPLLIKSPGTKRLYNYINGRTEDNEEKGLAQQYLAAQVGMWAEDIAF